MTDFQAGLILKRSISFYWKREYWPIPKAVVRSVFRESGTDLLESIMNILILESVRPCVLSEFRLRRKLKNWN